MQVVDGKHFWNPFGSGNVEEFYSIYRDEFEETVDAFLCMHSSAACEIFVPFNKPIILITPVRYDNGRAGEGAWKHWNQVLKKIAENPDNVVGANSKYDVEYMRYVRSRIL